MSHVQVREALEQIQCITDSPRIRALARAALAALTHCERHHEQCPWAKADPTRARSVCGCPEGWPKYHEDAAR